MSKVFFTADTHFGHNNIIKYANRPFDSVSEMDETIISRWNERVSADDLVYHLGDIGLCSSEKLRNILGRLNGRIHLIRGNHEKAGDDCANEFEWVKDYHELVINDQEAPRKKRLIVLSHYAMRVWNASHHGTWHLYGHSHGELEDLENSLSFDVGVDCHNYYPISYEEVSAIMAKKKWVSPFS